MRPQPSRRPSTQTKFKKAWQGGKDKRGGGLVLVCRYQLHLEREEHRSTVLAEVARFLEGHDGEEQLE